MIAPSRLILLLLLAGTHFSSLAQSDYKPVQFRWGLTSTMDGSYRVNSIDDWSDSEAVAYKNNRDSIDRWGLRGSFGAEFNWAFHERWGITAGVVHATRGYRRVTEWTDTIYSGYSYKFKNSDTYHFFDFPVRLNKYFRFNDRLHLDLNAGIVGTFAWGVFARASYQYSDEMLNNAWSFFEVGTNSGRVEIRYMLSAGSQFRLITKRNRVFTVGPQFNLSISKDRNTIHGALRYFSFGLKTSFLFGGVGGPQ